MQEPGSPSPLRPDRGPNKEGGSGMGGGLFHDFFLSFIGPTTKAMNHN